MLNFDPHRWLQEHEGQSVATVATVAGCQAENENRDTKGNVVGIGQVAAEKRAIPENANLSVLPATVATVATDTADVLRQWHRHLSAIDDFTPPSDWTLNNWLTLVDDARWLYENHVSYAVRNGWSVYDLFGVRPGMPHLGGLADFLEGSRSLKLCGGKAYWTQLGVKREIGVGCGAGCVLLWELK